jgi:hypothetical protein
LSVGKCGTKVRYISTVTLVVKECNMNGSIVQLNGDLYYALLRAHDETAAANPNGSIMVAHTVYKASGSMVNALAAAALCQGHLHAPIEAARDLLREGDNAADDAQSMIEYGVRVPGFGNSFYPDGDPCFAKVESMLREQHPELTDIIDNIRECNPKLPPANAAMWTAAVLEALRMPIGIGPAIFIAARVRPWAISLIQSDMKPEVTADVSESEDVASTDSTGSEGVGGEAQDATE